MREEKEKMAKKLLEQDLKHLARAKDSGNTRLIKTIETRIWEMLLMNTIIG